MSEKLKTKSTKVKTSISIDADLYQEILDESELQERSFSQQLSYRLRKGKEALFAADLAKIQAELK